MSDWPLRVFVVHGSSLRRRIVREQLAGLSGFECVGSASHLELAVEKIRTVRPDVLVISIESLRCSESVLATIASEASGNLRLMLLDQDAADVDAAGLPEAWRDRIEPFAPSKEAGRREIGGTARRLLARSSTTSPARNAAANGREPVRPADRPPLAVCIGVSTGGPEALNVVLPALPADFAAPVIVVQHMPKGFTRSLADDLDRRCALRVQEATDDLAVEPGSIYIAPGGWQTKLVARDDRVALRVVDDPPEQNCRPSVDYLFRSAAEVYGDRTLAVVMTGMGTDGAAGCRALRQRGAYILCQSERSCVVYGMPRAVAEQGLADQTVDLRDLSASIVELLQGAVAKC